MNQGIAAARGEGAMTTAISQAAVTIDFPRPREAVTSGRYTIIIAAPAAEKAEISIDGAPWHACRLSAGFWWHLWSGYAPGSHHVKVRARGRDGAVLALESRLVLVARPAEKGKV